MTIVYVDAEEEQVPATDATVYTAPNSVSAAIITHAVVCCEDATGDSITVNIVQAGGSVAVTNQYIQTKAVAAGETVVLSELIGVVLKGTGTAGDFVSAVAANASRLNLKLSIKEIYN